MKKAKTRVPEISVMRQYCVYTINALSKHFGVRKEELLKETDNIADPNALMTFESLREYQFFSSVYSTHINQFTLMNFLDMAKFKKSALHTEFLAAEDRIEQGKGHILMSLHVDRHPFAVVRKHSDSYDGTGGIFIQDADDAFLISPIGTYLEDCYPRPLCE